MPNFHIQEKSNFQAPVLVGVSHDEAPDSGYRLNYPRAKEALVPAGGSPWQADAPKWKWARFAVWGVAGNGAFVNPVWR